MKSIIAAHHVSIRYGQTETIHDVSFRIQKGDFIGLAGPNGAGKTTLIKGILGLVPLYKGTIELFGTPTERFREWGKIGYLPQKFSTINTLFPATVEEVVMLGLLSQKHWPKRITADDRSKVTDVLKELGIYNLKYIMLSKLSGGQQQKALLARALVSKPELLIFDEPSTALDPESRQAFFRLLQKLNKDKNITMILITHDTGYIGSYANKLLYIDHKLIHFGSITTFCMPGASAPYFEKSDQHVIWHQFT